MALEQGHGEALEDLVVDDHLVDEHIAQSLLVRAFRTLSDKIEVELSASAAASSPRVLGAFFASTAAWQLAYLRRAATSTVTALPMTTPPTAVVTDESGSGAFEVNTGKHSEVTPAACSLDILADTVSPSEHAGKCDALDVGYGEFHRQSFGNYAGPQNDGYGLDAYRRKRDRTKFYGMDRTIRRTSSEGLMPQPIRQSREVAMV